MARVTINPVEVKGPYDGTIAANGADLTFTAANVADKQQTPINGKITVLVQNSDAATPYTVTFTSIADRRGRTGDISTYSLGAGEIAAFEFEPEGWKQADGMLYYEASNAAIKFAVLNK